MRTSLKLAWPCFCIGFGAVVIYGGPWHIGLGFLLGGLVGGFGPGWIVRRARRRQFVAHWDAEQARRRG